MKNIFLIYYTLISLTSFGQETINDKNADLRNVSSFDAIKVSGAIEVYLSQGSSSAVAVSASEERFRDKIKTEVVNNTLKIYYDGDKFNWSTGNKKLKAYVSFIAINSLEANGASTLKISGTISGNNLSVRLTGASDLTGNIKFSKLTADISGASQIKLSGSVDNVDIDASGASDVKSYDLAADQCSVNVTGASDVRITVNKEISAHATGASSVFYKGEAVVKSVRTTGASSIAKKS
ncbi:MAG: head GIN domain-containing protein [Ginsengibacter sp.]